MEKSARPDVAVGVSIEKGSRFHNLFPFHAGHRNLRSRNKSSPAVFSWALGVDRLSLDHVPRRPVWGRGNPSERPEYREPDVEIRNRIFRLLISRGFGRTRL